MTAFFNTIKSLVFPLICPHCTDFTTDNWPILCQGCFESLELLNIEERCPICFQKHKTHNKHTKNHFCHFCKTKNETNPIEGPDYFAAAFEYAGPIKTLIHEFKYHDRPYLAKSFAAFLFMQFESLGWPTPDYILFIPQNFSKWLVRGYNQSELLAQELGKLLNVPVKNVLKKQGAHLSQAKLAKNERTALSPSTFTLKKESDISDKTILLIDDVYTTGSTIKQAVNTLRTGYPKNIYSLTVGFVPTSN